LTLPASVRVFVARGATDLRRSFDRLSAQVQEVRNWVTNSICFGEWLIAKNVEPIDR